MARTAALQLGAHVSVHQNGTAGVRNIDAFSLVRQEPIPCHRVALLPKWASEPYGTLLAVVGIGV